VTTDVIQRPISSRGEAMEASEHERENKACIKIEGIIYVDENI
jgi:hypothetical protein